MSKFTGWMKLGERWPYFGCVFLIALLWLVFVLIRPELNVRLATIMREAGIIAIGVIWSKALEARLTAVQLPRPLWLTIIYAAFVFLGCEQLARSGNVGIVLAPELFLLMQIPTIVLKSKPQVTQV